VSEIIFGLDLGQTKDPTALVGAERTVGPDGLASYAFRYLKRFHVGTPYTSAPGAAESGVVEFTDKLLTSPPFAGCNPVLAIDQTGVGRPVVDRFVATGRLNVVPITITAGSTASSSPPESGYGYHVAKKLLVSTVQLLFQSRRLTIAERLPEAAVLMKELQNFRVKVTTAANETFEAWREGDHDDLVLAVAMACWVGENVCCGAWEIAEDADNRSLLADVPEGIFLDGWPW
jgi:hypothetical protein